MTYTPIQLFAPSGELLEELSSDAWGLIDEADQLALADGIAKRAAIGALIRQQVQDAGHRVSDDEVEGAVDALQRIRSGEPLSAVQLSVYPGKSKPTMVNSHGYRSRRSTRGEAGMLPGFFEMERTYPDEDAKTWYDRLVGLDEHKSRLLIELELLFFPERLEAWSRKHHAGQVLRVCELHRNRVPLVLLEGDVGTGKTALAETVGDPLARTMKTHVHLLKINTQIRGSGQVGEMSHLIVQAFIHAEARAREKKNDPVLLLLDEADALAESRDTDQMHHEDRAGVNTLLQRVDNLRLVRLPLVAVFITNRSHALDPAIRRRAALNLRFERPDAVVRRLIFERSVPEVKLTDAQLAELVRLTGEQESRNEGLCFTASDITERLLPSAVRLAYPSRALRYEDLIEAADLMRPSPPVKTAMHVERYSDSTQHRS